MRRSKELNDNHLQWYTWNMYIHVCIRIPQPSLESQGRYPRSSLIKLFFMQIM